MIIETSLEIVITARNPMARRPLGELFLMSDPQYVGTIPPRRELSAGDREGLIAELISSAEGRERLAASMVQPLRVRRDYASVGRRTFLVEQLPDGALPIYDRDPEVAAFVTGSEDSDE